MSNCGESRAKRHFFAELLINLTMAAEEGDKTQVRFLAEQILTAYKAAVDGE